MLKNLALGVSTIVAAWMLAGPAQAGALISTDRLGYEGTVKQYATLADARQGGTAQETIQIRDRDASIYIANGMPGTADQNIVMGSWWYSTSATSAGWGNVNGNTGIGFMQLYDANGSTDTSVSMGFLGGGTQFHARVEGENATYAEDYARLSVYGNTGDKGTYVEYVLDLTVSGLAGAESGGLITATNHPTGVVGDFEGIFLLGTSYYAFDLDFVMKNWAYGQTGLLNGAEPDGFYASLFQQTVPEPATLALLGLGLAGIGVIRRRRTA